MKKILIVDDQTLNQILLEAYIYQYGEQNNESFEIRKADNGAEAVKMSIETPFDLIFMDILMPSMNGIEATKHIHTLLPRAIIVIVSTEGDEENQIQALRKGAKDYFVKPIQPDVFKHRLQLYMNMMNTDKGIIPAKQSVNPFSKSIFCYKTTYLIENEEDLIQLWESLLFKTKDSVRTNILSDMIRFMYQLGQVVLAHHIQPQIIIEENETHYFFSILNVNILSSQKMETLIDNYLYKADYQLKSNLLSFRVLKVASPVLNDAISHETLPEQMAPVEPIISEPVRSETDTLIKTKESEIIYEKEAESLQVFNFMEEEDLTSLELKLHELSTQFMWMGSNELNMDDVDQLVNAFERTSSILLLYSETQALGISIRDLSDIIKKDEQIFISMASQMSKLCNSFNNDLILWLKSVFYEGAPSVNFMDASIISNIQMIRSFLEPAGETDLDNADGLEFF